MFILNNTVNIHSTKIFKNHIVHQKNWHAVRSPFSFTATLSMPRPRAHMIYRPFGNKQCRHLKFSGVGFGACTPRSYLRFLFFICAETHIFFRARVATDFIYNSKSRLAAVSLNWIHAVARVTLKFARTAYINI